MQATPTRLLYHEDSYLSTFEAAVIAVEDRAVALNQTAFYPGGGGQMADQGALIVGGRRLPLASVAKRDEIVWHTLAEDAGAAPPSARRSPERLTGRSAIA